MGAGGHDAAGDGERRELADGLANGQRGEKPTVQEFDRGERGDGPGDDGEGPPAKPDDGAHERQSDGGGDEPELQV